MTRCRLSNLVGRWGGTPSPPPHGLTARGGKWGKSTGLPSLLVARLRGGRRVDSLVAGLGSCFVGVLLQFWANLCTYFANLGNIFCANCCGIGTRSEHTRGSLRYNCSIGTRSEHRARHGLNGRCLRTIGARGSLRSIYSSGHMIGAQGSSQFPGAIVAMGMPYGSGLF